MPKKMRSELDLYREIASLTGLSESEVYRVFNKMKQIAGRDLKLNQSFTLPGIGELQLIKRPRVRRRVRDFKNKSFYYMDFPESERLKFKINKDVKKEFERRAPGRPVPQSPF